MLDSGSKPAPKPKPQPQPKPQPTKPNRPANPNSKTVYITPTGSCYHYDPDCGGKNSYPVDLSEAKDKGYRPCKKCVH